MWQLEVVCEWAVTVDLLCSVSIYGLLGRLKFPLAPGGMEPSHIKSKNGSVSVEPAFIYFDNTNVLFYVTREVDSTL